MELSREQWDRLVEILRNTATGCHDAISGNWDRSDEGFQAMESAAESGLTILAVPLPDYDGYADDDFDYDND